VGLDRRGAIGEQSKIFEDILGACKNAPVLISVHSAGRTKEVVALLEKHRHPGLLHE
jgi:TatD DNase family protein